MVLGGPRREHVFGLTSLREEVGRLHGVLQVSARECACALTALPSAARPACIHSLLHTWKRAVYLA